MVEGADSSEVGGALEARATLAIVDHAPPF
jgi:hypothetical protein